MCKRIRIDDTGYCGRRRRRSELKLCGVVADSIEIICRRLKKVVNSLIMWLKIGFEVGGGGARFSKLG